LINLQLILILIEILYLKIVRKKITTRKFPLHLQKLKMNLIKI